MTKYRFLSAAAWGSLAGALVFTALPAHAQDPDRGRAWGREARAEGRAEARAEVQANGGNDRAQRSAPSRSQRPEGRSAERSGWTPRPDAAPAAQRDRSGQWAAQRQARDAAAQQQREQARQGGWARPDGRQDGASVGNRGTAGWQRDPSYGANTRTRDWQRDSRNDARREDWQRDRRQEGWRAERRDDARNYSNGYRDGRRDDSNRYGQAYRQWDNRGWRNDNRYDWYRYRAANRSIFSPGRYYAPYRNYSYSRVNIGFRLGSGFYSNRYWINDPWRYRLPDAYGPYRWVRYYDDALLVDIYSGQVVDVITNFFW